MQSSARNHKKSLLTLRTTCLIKQLIPTHREIFEAQIRDMLANLLGVSRGDILLVICHQADSTVLKVLLCADIKNHLPQLKSLFAQSELEFVSLIEDLRGVDLGQFNLNKAALYKETLYQAKLSGSDLSGANLNGVDLKRVNMHGANLSVTYPALY